MKIQKSQWNQQQGWVIDQPLPDADLVLVFGDNRYFSTSECFEHLKASYPKADIVGCSTAGNILGGKTSDDDIVAMAVKFEKGRIKVATADQLPGESSQDLGTRLVSQLETKDLNHIVVISEGLNINGSQFAAGLNKLGVPASGGLSADGMRFGKTFVIANSVAKTGRSVAIGLYGDLKAKVGCYAGWKEFGPERVVTRSDGNIVYEIDGQSALALYKKYLGDLADELPSSGMRFPLSIRQKNEEDTLIRTLLGIDEDSQSLRFAGDVPEGSLCKLMNAQKHRLIEAAEMAANLSNDVDSKYSYLCLSISCVGRRVVLGQLIDEESEEVSNILGGAASIVGFYSYGELAPGGNISKCNLHNQTITITTITE